MICRRWYHPNLQNASAATRLLLEQGFDGSFLIRPSCNFPGNYTLSVRFGDQVEHVSIKNEGEHYCIYDDEFFATLSELIEYYTEQTLITKEGQLLRLARFLYTGDSVNERWYHGNIQKVEVERLFEGKGEGTFLVRESVTQPGSYVISVKTVQDGIMHILINYKEGKYFIPGSGSPPRFNSLTELVEYYIDHPLTSQNGGPYHLKQPVHSTRINVSNIAERSTLLDSTSDQGGPKKTGFFEEFNILLGSESKQTNERKVGSLEENRPKNRYKNILPFDHTRVILKNSEGGATDYINANYIRGEDENIEKPLFIATQGCLPQTVPDFWRMVWQENSLVIVNLTRPVEKGKTKCAVYWCNEGEPPKKMEVSNCHLTLSCVRSEDRGDYILRELQLTRSKAKGQDGATGCKKKTVYLFHFMSWPDKSVPTDPGPLLDFQYEVKSYQESIKNCGPVVVHCSAGIGRTGAFIVLSLIVSEIEEKGIQCEIDILRTIQHVRAQRSGMVQTEGQYKFLYQSVQHYVESKNSRTAAPSNCNQQAPRKGFTNFKNAPRSKQMQKISINSFNPNYALELGTHPSKFNQQASRKGFTNSKNAPRSKQMQKYTNKLTECVKLH